MTKRRKFAEAIATQLNTTKSFADDLLVLFSATAHAQLLIEDEVVFPGLGKLKVEIRPARKGHNPRTGESIDIPEKRVIKFKPATGAI